MSYRKLDCTWKVHRFGSTADKSHSWKLTHSRFSGRLPTTAERYLLLRRSGLFQDGLFAGGGRGNCYGRLCGLGGGRGGYGSSAFGVGLFQETFGGPLRAAGVVVGLFGFGVFVDGALALAEHVKNFSEIDVAPDFSPFFRGLGHGLQGFAEGVGGGLIVLLVEEGLAHAEIGERAAWLNGKRSLILGDGVVKTADRKSTR